LKEAVWKEETTKFKKLLIQCDLIGVLGDVPLVNFDKFSFGTSSPRQSIKTSS
jgi:hypothetical protein